MTIEATQSTGAESIESRIESRLSGDAQSTSSTPPAEATQPDVDQATQLDTQNPPEPDQPDKSTDDDAEQVELDAETLASMFGLDPSSVLISDDGKLAFKTKVDGQEGQTTLADLVKSYQLEGHVNKRSMELAEQRKAFEQEAAAAKQLLTERTQQAEAVVGLLSKQLNDEYQSINWNALRQANPAEYAALQYDFQQRGQAIEGITSNLQAMVQQQQAQAKAESDANYGKRLVGEFQALVDKIPAWKDPKVAQAESSELMGFLKESGFNDDEVNDLIDHRHILLVRDAMAYRKNSAAAGEVTDKIKKKLAIPVLKAGSRQTNADKQRLTTLAAKKALRASGGSVDAAASLLFDRM